MKRILNLLFCIAFAVSVICALNSDSPGLIRAALFLLWFVALLSVVVAGIIGVNIEKLPANLVDGFKRNSIPMELDVPLDLAMVVCLAYFDHIFTAIMWAAACVVSWAVKLMMYAVAKDA